MSLSKTQIFLFFESGNYVKATWRLPQASSLSCLHRFIIIFIAGAICIIVLKFRIVPIVLVIVHIISIWVENYNFQMGGKILFCVDEIVLFFQFRVEISTQDTKKQQWLFQSLLLQTDVPSGNRTHNYSLGVQALVGNLYYFELG